MIDQARLARLADLGAAVSQAEGDAAARNLVTLGVNPASDLVRVFKRVSVRSLTPEQELEEPRDELVSPITLGSDGQPRLTDDAWRTQMGSSTAYMHAYWGVPKRYIGLSSIEGEGAYLFDTVTDAVYDYGLGDEGPWGSDEVVPEWGSVVEFFDWYIGEGE